MFCGVAAEEKHAESRADCGDFSPPVKATFALPIPKHWFLRWRIVQALTTLPFMADDDFDLERLADYLHLTLAQVARLSERGKLPGRKVQGQWRFAQAEIHHWLEKRIGLSDEEELQQMESFLRPMSGHLAGRQPIAELLPLAAIEVPVAARTRNSVISTICDRRRMHDRIPKMAEAVCSAECSPRLWKVASRPCIWCGDSQYLGRNGF
jgi:hypothetical protein